METKEPNTCDWGSKLDSLVSDLKPYLNPAKVANRHEAWFLVTAVSNMALMEQIQGLRTDMARLEKLLQNGHQNVKIKGDKNTKRKKLEL